MNIVEKTVLWVVVIGLVVWGGMTLLKNGKPEVVKTNEPIRIGFIGPLVGEAASFGVVAKAAVEIAVGEVNATGGINGRQLEVIYEDGKCSASPSVSAASKLINIDKVPVIIGGLCSSETAAFAPEAMKQKVVVFSYASSAPNLSKLGKYFFRSYPSDNFQGKFAAEYVFNNLKFKKVAVLYHISDWGTGIKDVFVSRFKELGGTIVFEDGTAKEATDYRTALSKIKEAAPDLIYAPMYPDGGGVMIKQAQSLGIKVPIFGGDAWDDPKLHKDVSGNNGTILYSVSFSPISDEFKVKMKNKTGKDEVSAGTPNAYDNIKIIAQVLAKTGTNTDKIQEELRKVEYDGVSGHISFDENGDIKTANYIVKKIVNGTAAEVK